MTDPIADYLTRLRNALKASHKIVEIPASNMKKELTKVLFDKGYILNYKFEQEGPQGNIKIALKYKVNDFALWIDGVERATDTSGLAPIGLNTVALDQAGGDNFYGKVKQLQVYDTALTDEQLEALTT